MKKSDLELLGLSEGATEEQIKEAYEKLRAKYLEDRFKDGEEGNEAARMLTKLDTAYSEIMSELAESNTDKGGTSFERVEELIRSGNIQEAQRVLDSFNERSARWHYLQSVVFYKKSWMNESKKQLEIAMQLELDNDKYKEAYRKLNDRIKSTAQQAQGQPNNGGQQGVYQGETMQSTSDEQMGGNFCSTCIQCCALNMCINMLCNCCR